jgi:hypothetical protein
MTREEVNEAKTMKRENCLPIVDLALQSKLIQAGHWWPMPLILATQEAEIRRIMVLSQPRQKICISTNTGNYGMCLLPQTP